MSMISGLGSGNVAWPQKDEARTKRADSRGEAGELGKKRLEPLDTDSNRAGRSPGVEVARGDWKAGRKDTLQAGASTVRFATGRQPPIIEPDDAPIKAAAPTLGDPVLINVVDTGSVPGKAAPEKADEKTKAKASENASTGGDAMALAKQVVQRYAMGRATGLGDPVMALAPPVIATA